MCRRCSSKDGESRIVRGPGLAYASARRRGLVLAQRLVLASGAPARNLAREIAGPARDRRSVRDLRAADHPSASARSSPPSSPPLTVPTLEPRHPSGFLNVLGERCPDRRSNVRGTRGCFVVRRRAPSPIARLLGRWITWLGRLCARPRARRASRPRGMRTVGREKAAGCNSPAHLRIGRERWCGFRRTSPANRPRSGPHVGGTWARSMDVHAFGAGHRRSDSKISLSSVISAPFAATAASTAAYFTHHERRNRRMVNTETADGERPAMETVIGWTYFVAGSFGSRRDGPFSTSLWAPWMRRSQIASAWVGSLM